MNPVAEVQFPDIHIPMRDVIRRLGYPPGKEPDAGIRRLLDEEMARAQRLFVCRGVYRVLPIRALEPDRVSFEGTDFVIESHQVANLLREASQAAFFMVTLGKELEEAVKRLLEHEETTRAFVLDAIGSETADALADVLHWQILSEAARGQGMRVTARFSPGYRDWPVTVQPEIHRLCEGHRIGISVTEACLMIPRKSVSAVLGWMPVRSVS